MVLPSNYGEGNILNNITSFAKYGIPLVDVFDTVFLIELQLLDILLDLHCDVVFSPPVHLFFSPLLFHRRPTNKSVTV